MGKIELKLGLDPRRRVARGSSMVAAVAVLLGIGLAIAPGDAMAITFQGVINRLDGMVRNGVPRLADLGYFISPFLFIGALVVSLCRRRWSMVMGTLLMGVAYVINMHNSDALPGFDANSASLYHTSNIVFLFITAVLGLIFLRVLFMSKG